MAGFGGGDRAGSLAARFPFSRVPTEEVPLYPQVDPPALVELVERDKQLVRVMRELNANNFSGPFRVAEQDDVDIERYSDRFRTKFSRLALLESWLPADAKEYFPQELLRAARTGALASKDEVARAARAAARGSQSAAAKALAAWQKKEERLRKKKESGAAGVEGEEDEDEDEEEEGEGEEGEEEEEEEFEDFNDYGIDYYDSGMDDDDDDDGGGGAVF